MDSAAHLVPRGTAVYREFERLYRLARTLRPTTTDRWNGVLLAGGSGNWGSVDRRSGAITLSDQHVLRHLRGSGFPSTAAEQAQALATILHETTHAGMEIDAPQARNAIRSNLIWNVMEGVAEVRAMADIEAFADRAGYGELPVPDPQYPAPYAAIEGLIVQASGPRKGDGALLDALSRGPGVLHLDCLADGVLQNRLADVVPTGDHPAVRAALIRPMLHPAWTEIRHMGSSIGTGVARDIAVKVNSAVDAIRGHYASGRNGPFPGDVFDPAVRERGGGASTPDPDHRADGSARGAAMPSAQDKVPEMRFLDGLAPAAGAARRPPSLGQGARGAGRPAPPNPERTTGRDR
ncbi:hypothetical protein ACQPXM_27770 [Kribbella sp. CA-253562]|uniref:hypothetical protein n=1 Tax=Kribbella sp. CA-253562 TaxID=3239942 RepID=UPI003D94F1BE